MAQLESLMELDIHCTAKKKKKYALVDLSNENFIVLHHYVEKILKSHGSKLVHFTHQGTCVAFNT